MGCEVWLGVTDAANRLRMGISGMAWLQAA
jgi:hypothetical protein